MDFYDLEDLITEDERPTEDAAELRLERMRKLNWRVKAWGSVMLTEREHEAMRLEMDAIYERAQAFKDAERDANRFQKDHMERDRAKDFALFVALCQLGHYESDREAYHAQLLCAIERGIQSQIARRMGVSQGRISQLLTSASGVMDYLQETQVFAGWRETVRGRNHTFTLVAEVAVTKKSGQILHARFAPPPLEKAA